jgi:geranylgeranyl reductase
VAALRRDVGWIGQDRAPRGRADPHEAPEALGRRPRVLLAGDAAGVVAPASGEGIYYAMLGGRLAAEAVRNSWPAAIPRACARRASAS